MPEERYDIRGYCINLKKVSLSKIERRNDTSYEIDHIWRRKATCYKCHLTNERCVGSLENMNLFSDNDILSPRIIERCPSRKTIDNLLKQE